MVNTQQQIILSIQNEKLRYYNTMGMMITGINTLSFFVFALSKNSLLLSISFSVIGIINSVELYLRIKKFRTNKLNEKIFPVGYFTSSIGWVINSQYVVAALNLLLVFFEKIIKHKKTIKLTKEGVEFPSFPVQHFAWSQIQNLVLKDGLLTIDLANNKLIQVMISAAIDEASFNLFCKKQLAPLI